MGEAPSGNRRGRSGGDLSLNKEFWDRFIELGPTICETASKDCTGSNTTQYDNQLQCMAFLGQKIRLGSSYEFGMNTVQCRSLHELMVPLRLDVHCPHIGHTGGGTCVDNNDYDMVAETSVMSTDGLCGAKNRET